LKERPGTYCRNCPLFDILRRAAYNVKNMVQLTEETFEQALSLCREPSLIDLRDLAFVDPYGMVGVLELGLLLCGSGVRPTLLLPASGEVLKYLERMDFFKYAHTYFTLEPSAQLLPERYPRSSYSDVLLEITPIEKSDDIHFIVGKVKSRAHAILDTHLRYDERATDGFIVALSEVCQNVIEHSKTRGFVGIQKYRFKNLNKNVVKIAVMDSGVGFRKSLSERFDVHDDLDAIEMALLYGASRHADEGRGHGLLAVKRFVNQWTGKITIRSGTARLSVLPGWAWGRPRESNLAYFPGSQINILLPEA
jgi:anti-sigma regulatory factor (Ser/Thr protein kinase)